MNKIITKVLSNEFVIRLLYLGQTLKYKYVNINDCKQFKTYLWVINRSLIHRKIL